MKSIVIKYVYDSSNKLYKRKGEMKMSREELAGMKLEALKGMVKELGLKGLSRANKQGLVDAIYEATKEADPEVTQLEITDTIPTTKAPKRAILKTFTGMLIGKVKEDGTPFTYDLVEQGGLYRLTKLDGKVLEFDKATLKQVNAKNPKFANKIELV